MEWDAKVCRFDLFEIFLYKTLCCPQSSDLQTELEASNNESRNYSLELCRLKTAWEEVREQADLVKRENKNLAEEIRDLLDQLGDGGRSIQELEKQRRRLEVWRSPNYNCFDLSLSSQVEKENLQNGLEEAEAALEQEENKVLRGQLELAQLKKEIDQRIQEKEEEFKNTRWAEMFIYKNLSFLCLITAVKTMTEPWILSMPPWKLNKMRR